MIKNIKFISEIINGTSVRNQNSCDTVNVVTFVLDQYVMSLNQKLWLCDDDFQ